MVLSVEDAEAVLLYEPRSMNTLKSTNTLRMEPPAMLRRRCESSSVARAGAP